MEIKNFNKKKLPERFQKYVPFEVEEVAEEYSLLGDDEEDIWEPEKDLEESQAAIEPESVINVLHQHESKHGIGRGEIFLLGPEQHGDEGAVVPGRVKHWLQRSLEGADIRREVDVLQLLTRREEGGEKPEDRCCHWYWDDQTLILI